MIQPISPTDSSLDNSPDKNAGVLTPAVQRVRLIASAWLVFLRQPSDAWQPYGVSDDAVSNDAASEDVLREQTAFHSAYAVQAHLAQLSNEEGMPNFISPNISEQAFVQIQGQVSKRVPEQVPEILKNIVCLELIALPLMLVAALPVSLMNEAGYLKETELFDTMPFALLLLLVSVVAPVIEEIAFRAHLRFGVGSLTWMCALAVAFVCAIFSLWSIGVTTVMIWAGGVVCFSAAAWSIVRYGSKPAVKAQWHERWHRQYALIFYGTALLFACLHAPNYENTSSIKHLQLWLAPILTLPQFIAGLQLGYVRLRYGLVWSMAMHGLHNGILTVIGKLSEVLGSVLS
jgi:membrane protease YdiL (CAAX protease family)